MDYIKKYTFICEYSGRVYSSEDLLCADSDSVMILQHENKQKRIKGLVILPDEVTNIARYISKINMICFIEKWF